MRQDRGLADILTPTYPPHPGQGPPYSSEEEALLFAYPNPFNSRTVIEYTLPEASSVSSDIYDILGPKLATLDEGQRPAGSYRIAWGASGESSGVYFCRFNIEGRPTIKKLTLIR